MSNDQSQETLRKLATIAGVLILVSLVFGPGGGIVTIVELAAKLLWLVFLVSLTVGLFVALRNNFDDFQFGRVLSEFANFTYCPSCGKKTCGETTEKGGQVNEQVV